MGLRAWQREVMAAQARDGTSSDEARDAAMAEVLLEMRDLVAPGARTVIWAHNVHLATAWERVRPGAAGGFRSMGSRLVERLGDDYAPIALMAWDTDINWTTVPKPRPAGARTVEARLHALGIGDALVDLRDGPLPAGRQFGLGPGAGPAVLSVIPAEQWRAVLYLDQSRASLPTWTARLARDDEAARAAAREGRTYTFREPRDAGATVVGWWRDLFVAIEWRLVAEDGDDPWESTWDAGGRTFAVSIGWDRRERAWRARISEIDGD